MKTVLISLVFFAHFSFAQTDGSVRGLVKTSDLQPAHAVSVAIKGTDKTTATNARGEFEINHIAPGSYVLIASSVGLETKEISAEVRAGETAFIPEIILKASVKELAAVDVSASRDSYSAKELSPSLRLTSPILELPQNIQVVTSEMLKDQQVISMSDGLIRNVSGAVRVEHWGDLFTKIFSRGSQAQAFRNGFNAVNSFWGPLTEDMSFVQRIEFVKGPAGFMLSHGDPGGLYNVVTKKPTGISKGEASFTLGSFDLYRTTLDLDGKASPNGKLLYRLNLSAQNKKSFRANEFNDRYVIAPVLSYQLDARTKLTLEYNYQRANMSDVGSYYVFSTQGLATLPRNFTMMPGGMSPTKINDHSLYAMLTHSFHKNWNVTAQASKFLYDQQGTSMWPTQVNGDGTIIRQVGSWEAKSGMTMGQVFVTGEFSSGLIHHRALGGLDLANKSYLADWQQAHPLDTETQKFDVNNPNLGEPPNGYPKFDFSTPLEERAQKNNGGGLIDQRYSGIYLQDELGAFENKVRLTLAGRFTYVRQSQYGGKPPRVANRFTPRLGLSYSLDKYTTAYALYDQAFTPQSGQLSNGNAVRPITGENRELGVKRDWFGGTWNTALSYYHIVKKHELIGDPNAPVNSGLSIELGEKKSEGVEFDIKGSVARGLTLTANYAYTDSRVTKLAQGVTSLKEGGVVPGYATHTANCWMSYKLNRGPLQGTGASLGATYLGKRQTFWTQSPDPAQTLPNYLKLDGGLFWEKERLKITANVFNILDAYLYGGSYYSWLKAYYWQADPPRNIRLSIAYSF